MTASPTVIYLVRHAESAPAKDIPEPEWPLSARGRRQAAALVDSMRELGLQALYSSPYSRAQDTIKPLAETLRLELGILDDLRERKLSSLDLSDGQWLPALERCWGDPELSLEGGESNNACQARVVRAIEELARVHHGQTIAAASHGNAISLFLQSVEPRFGLEGWRSMRNPDLFRIAYRDGQATWDGRRYAEKDRDG